MLFNHRSDAGKQLAQALLKYKDRQDVVVLGLARGGVVIAAEVAAILGAFFHAIAVRKIGAPGNEGLALGALAERGDGIFNDHLIGMLDVSQEYLKRETEKQKKIIKEKHNLYGSVRRFPELKGKTVLLVDDGIATGASMRAAMEFVSLSEAAKVVLAVPVSSPDSLQKIEKEADEVVCVLRPLFFETVASFYRVFDPVNDSEVVHLLSKK